jgi:hypothetical protein
MRTSITTLVFLAVAPSASALQTAPVAAPERVPITIQPDRVPGERVPPTRPVALSASRPSAFAEGVNVRDLGPVSPAELDLADAEAGLRTADVDAAQNVRSLARRVGIVRPLASPPLLETELGDGRKLWTLAVRSTGAFGTRIHFTEFDAAGGEVVVYGLDASGALARGPYKDLGPGRRGEFWTPSIPGEMAFVEVVGHAEPRIVVGEVVHFDQDPNAALQLGGQPGSGVLSCHFDAQCVPAALENPRDATGQMNFVSGGGSFVCTGTLMSDQDATTYVPYFLTAAHCVNTQSEVSSLEVVWYWESSFCDATTLPDWFTLDRNAGEQLLATTATDDSNDMSFLRLEYPLPPGLPMAGLTTGSLTSVMYGIHHPAGSYKRYTLLEDSFHFGCSLIDASDYHFTEALAGTIEGGSSGSGLFSSSGLLLGHLRGACGSTSDPTCNADGWRAFYGEMEESWPIINHWLQDLGGTIRVNSSTTSLLQKGTAAFPFKTVSQAAALAWDGSRILVTTGSYPESVTIADDVDVVPTGGSVVIGG